MLMPATEYEGAADGRRTGFGDGAAIVGDADNENSAAHAAGINMDLLKCGLPCWPQAVSSRRHRPDFRERCRPIWNRMLETCIATGANAFSRMAWTYASATRSQN